MEPLPGAQCRPSVFDLKVQLFLLWGDRATNQLPPVCPFRIEFLRHIRDFFQIMFKMDVQKPLEDERKGGDKVLMTCVGVGYSNMNKTLK